MKYNPNYPTIPMNRDYMTAIRVMSVLRDFYGYDFRKNCKEKPNSYFGKKSALMQRAINLLPASLRHEYEAGGRK